MRISFHGRVVDEPEIRAGFIGCGSHSFRNIYPTFQFAPVRLVATCDLSLKKAQAFAAKFGAQNAYADYRAMLEHEELDAVFIVVGYDATGRPLYPRIAVDCLDAGRHVWMEKPPAASCAEIDTMRQAAKRSGKNVVVGLKKMFFPANEKAKALLSAADFGRPSLVLLQYPQYVPTEEEFRQFAAGGKKVDRVTGFLDHLCHPASLLVYLLGMPTSLSYERSSSGAGVATFRFESGAVASLALTCGSSLNGGMERTTIISDSGKHIVVENNLRLSYHRTPPSEPGTGYGSAPSFYTGSPDQTTAVWEPEFSLGQLYNKGLFLLGYYNEVAEFARSILERRPPAKGTLEHAWQVTRIFEAFAEGPGRPIPLNHRSTET
jgi:predicted dehydrogenase